MKNKPGHKAHQLTFATGYSHAHEPDENAYPASRAAGDEPLDLLRQQVEICRKCRLGYDRIHAVFGGGSRTARLMFIGEAPGAQEDQAGEPFIGRAGQFLTRTLEMHGITRSEVFVSNIVKCRPPNNRDPMPDEIAACAPYLFEQIDQIKPSMLCALGRFAAAALLGRPVKITQEHGKWLEYRGIPFLIAMHPSAAMRSTAFKLQFEHDIAVLAARYREEPESRQE